MVSMPALHEAQFYERLPEREVRCTLCPHDCRIRDGGRGACAVRFNHGGTLYTVVYDRVISRDIDPVEKKPLFHFLPGSRAYSIATVGCNLRCAFCQNWEISQWPKDMLRRAIDGSDASKPAEPVCAPLATIADAVIGEHVTPQQIVNSALAMGCRSVAYTYTEPTVFYELAYYTATLARAKGLKNIFVNREQRTFRVVQHGVRAGQLGADTGNKLAAGLGAGVTLDIHASDQPLVYLALASGESRFTARTLTNHARTTMWLVEQLSPRAVRDCELRRGRRDRRTARITAAVITIDQLLNRIRWDREFGRGGRCSRSMCTEERGNSRTRTAAA